MILVITGDADDPHCAPVLEGLAKRGAGAFLWEHSHFPSRAEVSLRYGAGAQPRAVLRAGGRELDLAEVTAVWMRRLPLPGEVSQVQDVDARAYLHREATAFLTAALRRASCPWVPGPPSAVVAAQDKAEQLSVASGLGFAIPPTLISNSPDEFLAFYREHDGRVVSKSFASPLVKREGEALPLFAATEVVSHRRVGYAKTIQSCPCIFQAYVPKALELRITVVGDRAFACEIHSQKTHHTRHDWRKYDLSHTPHFEHELPAAVRERCLALVRHYGLCYGAIDLVLTPDREYVFLEINPVGQYAWIERLTAMPISEAIADLLVAATARGGMRAQRVAS
jgi:glutathione synthase/RimK-type ligase-like ATP-grasp enzyme